MTEISKSHYNETEISLRCRLMLIWWWLWFTVLMQKDQLFWFVPHSGHSFHIFANIFERYMSPNSPVSITFKFKLDFWLGFFAVTKSPFFLVKFQFLLDLIRFDGISFLVLRISWLYCSMICLIVLVCIYSWRQSRTFSQ